MLRNPGRQIFENSRNWSANPGPLSRLKLVSHHRRLDVWDFKIFLTARKEPTMRFYIRINASSLSPFQLTRRLHA